MIRNFRHKGLAALYHGQQTRGVMQAHVKRLRIILALRDTAKTVDAVRLSKAFGRSPEGWLQMQYDLAQVLVYHSSAV